VTIKGENMFNNSDEVFYDGMEQEDDTDRRDFEKKLKEANDEIESLRLALRMLKEYAVQNGLDLSPVCGGYSPGQKPLKQHPRLLKKEEIRKRNDETTVRQLGKHAVAEETTPQPTPEDLLKMYSDRLRKQHDDFTSELLKLMGKDTQNE
jgi:hypothetical protein